MLQRRTRRPFQDLVVSLRRAEMQKNLDDTNNEELFTQFFPISKPDVPEVEVAHPSISVPEASVANSHKRSVSLVANWSPILKKSKIPDLASLSQLSTIAAAEGLQKKRILVTREKLGAGLHYPKALLILVGPSTNALERTKKMEFVKSSCMLFDSQKNHFTISLQRRF